MHGSMPPGLPCFLSSDSHPVSTKFLSVSLAWEAQKPLSPLAAKQGRAKTSLRIRLLLAAEAAHGQIFGRSIEGIELKL